MQGWRISMEDAHITVLDLLAALTAEEAKAHSSRLSFFGVFDGHGGDKVAQFAGENIHTIVAKQVAFRAGNYEQALKDGFLATDRAILTGMAAHARDMPVCRRPLGRLGMCLLTTMRSCRSEIRRGSVGLHSVCGFNLRRQDLHCEDPSQRPGCILRLVVRAVSY
jgi:hypothetical protein